MKAIGIAALGATFLSGSALAADAPMLHSGALIVTGDGKRVGYIDSVTSDKSGATWAEVILDDRVVYIPATTLTPGDKKRLVTSMTMSEVRHLK